MDSRAAAEPIPDVSPSPFPNPSAVNRTLEERLGLDLVQVYDWDWWGTLVQSGESLLLILSTLWCILLARVVCHKLRLHGSADLCFAMEFILVILPCILLVSVAVDYSGYIGLIMLGATLWFLRTSRALERARTRVQFDLGGNRPMCLSILRALTHLITAVCILAIDFGSFYRPYRKSRQFGAKLMDTGIGLFVFTKAMVSRRTFTGLISAGFLGALVSILARKDLHLLPLGFGLLVIHQFGLSVLGISDYVMNEDVERSSFLNANREGLVSLPGFVGLFLLSIYVNRWMVAKSLLSYSEFVRKLRRLFYLVLILWTSFVISAYEIGISRVTCNLGYVIWVLAIGSTTLCASFGAIDFAINSVMPWDPNPSEDQEKGLLSGDAVVKKRGGSVVPFTISQALNKNGLTFFLVANVVTGMVNIFLRPEDRTHSESVIILLVYMFLATKLAHELLKRGIRLA
ncbi:GM14174 [Drosophila sechellia]|uniref:Phosphatidylinositol-glycan biosynthesis class W protein n=1 Tax=Drosophila sechellia TaxID=7238 RepID=B4HVZ3_DROSE|nr:GM14174 [Drosophila sechellia]